MEIQFHGNSLSTDYFGSTDCRRGLAWLAVHERNWHLLLPRSLRSSHVVQAVPVPAEDERGGWMWCLDVDGEEFPLPAERIHGARPELPDRGRYWKRTGLLYTGDGGNASQAAFGGVYGGLSGLHYTVHVLWLTYGMKVGYKPRGE